MSEPPFRARPVLATEAAAWAAAGGDPDPAAASSAEALWASGSGRPAWTFVVEDVAGAAFGRVAIAADPVAPGYPELEHRVVGLRLPWTDARVEEAGRVLLDAAIAAAVGPAGGTVDARVNPETHDVPLVRVRVLVAAAFVPFQEKAGVVWEDDGSPLPEPARLRTEGTNAGNAALLRDAMARAGEGTLDRQDRHYRALTGPSGWADVMWGYLTDEDTASWLLARDADGNVAGYVLLGAFDEPGTGTIVHVGVVPEARGRGYGHGLLLAANRAARARGFARIVSDVDVENGPMLAAMARAGHRTGVRPWHVWHVRRHVPPAR